MSTEADHRRARATSFGAAVVAYERGRPTYRDAAVDWMLARRPARVLDLGAGTGTGKLARSLVARGLDTLAADPSSEMLARLPATLPAVETPVGAAEAIPLPDAHVEAVVVGQAWHWVEPAGAPTARAKLDAQLRAFCAEAAGGDDRLAVPYLTHAFRAVLPPAAQ